MDEFINLLPIILVFVVFYILLYLPQRRRAKKHAAFIEDLKIGSMPDLHNLENIKINFSWEESVTPTSLIIKLRKDSYIVNKNKFNHKVKNKNIQFSGDFFYLN